MLIYSSVIKIDKEMVIIISKKIDKTNVMRILESKKIEYEYYTYDEKLVNAVDVANHLGRNPEILFKTLVTVGKSNEN